ncbi:MAG: BatD family protein [Gammaproteobacteria bacterium]|nr:BatD family protein [Gammaproteobacteria bacterium]
MVVTHRHSIFLPVLFCSLMLFAGLAGAEISVSIDRNPVHVNQSFQLYFEADGPVDGEPDFSLLPQHFAVLNNSQTSSISIINGEYRRSIKWTLQLMPGRAGDFIVPAIHFGKQKTRPFQVTVKPANQASAPASGGLTIELVADKSSLYVQSQVVVTIRLMSDSYLSRLKIGNLEFNNMDVVVESLGNDSQYQTTVNDREYLVWERKIALFPQQSGTLEIKPVLAEVKLSAGSRSLFDPFRTSGQVVRLRSQGLTLEILTVADSFKAQHWLPSSGIQLTEDWQGDLGQLSAGLPVTRTLTLTAEGLTAAQLPDLSRQDIQGIKQYPDKPTLEDRRSGAGIIGKRQQKIALVATSEGRYILPEISIPWWNLNTEQLEFARIPSRTLEIRAGADTATSSLPASGAGSTVTDGSVATPRKRPQPNYFWVWLSVFLGAGWTASLLIWWFIRRGSQGGANKRSEPVEMRYGKAGKRLQQACASNNAVDAREAMLIWANALKPGHRFTNLNQVTHFFGNPLKQHIDALNQSLYGQSTGEWSGDKLWSSCEQTLSILKPGWDKSISIGLMPLNP